MLDTDKLSLWYDCELVSVRFADVYTFGYNGVLLARGGVWATCWESIRLRPTALVWGCDFVLSGHMLCRTLTLCGARMVLRQSCASVACLFLQDIEKSCGVREVAAGKRDGLPSVLTSSWGEYTLRGES